jgi:hypothetical protein
MTLNGRHIATPHRSARNGGLGVHKAEGRCHRGRCSRLGGRRRWGPSARWARARVCLLRPFTPREALKVVEQLMGA